MNAPVIVLALLDLALIGALPRVFFVRGRLNAAWWLTAAPFMLAAVTLVAAASGALSPLGPQPAALAAVAVVLFAASILLTGVTLGTHHVPLSLWHQADGLPRHLVTRGPYSRVRHPFYTSFLLCLAGCSAAFPHPLTATAFCFAVVRLNQTAAREEAALLRSRLGARYRKYMQGTGRFLPVVRGGSAAAHSGRDGTGERTENVSAVRVPPGPTGVRPPAAPADG